MSKGFLLLLGDKYTKKQKGKKKRGGGKGGGGGWGFISC
jgi:hypothetical protein